jgi:hypothetical protein
MMGKAILVGDCFLLSDAFSEGFEPQAGRSAIQVSTSGYRVLVLLVIGAGER